MLQINEMCKNAIKCHGKYKKCWKILITIRCSKEKYLHAYDNVNTINTIIKKSATEGDRERAR